MKTKLVLFISLLAALATNAAAEEFVCSTNSVGTIRLDAYLPDSNPSKTVIVPDYVNVIGEYAFCDQATITCVYLPDSVTEIRNGAFCGCYTLSHIRMSLNIEVIKGSAFQDCHSLSYVYIPNKDLISKYIGFNWWCLGNEVKPWMVMATTGDPKAMTLIYEGQLEVSTDLINWSPVNDLSSGSTGLYTVPMEATRFFRTSTLSASQP